MNLDDELRAALRSEPEGAHPDGDAWDGVRDRARRVRERRQRAIGAGALSVVVALVVGIAVFAGGSGDGSPTVAAGPTVTGGLQAGDEVVAIVDDRLVVLSPDGEVVRVLVEGVDALTFGGVSVSPDGGTVYFARSRAALPCERQEIVKVPIDGGPVEVVVALGANPLVSPDGKTLAYSRPPERNEACGPYSTIAQLDLADGTSDEIVATEVQSGVPLAWLPDGEALLFATYGDVDVPDPELALLSIVGRDGVMEPLAPDLITQSATYLADGRLVAALRVDGGHRIVVVNDDGSVGETLLESGTPGVLHSMQPNASGDVLLHFGGSVLQRWTPGGGAPVTILDGLVRDAAWLPGATPDEPTTTASAPTTTAARSDERPETFYEVDGRTLVERSSDDGRVVRTVTNDLPVGGDTSISVTADRAFAVVGGDGPDQMTRVDLATGETTGLGLGAYPIVSRDGSQLAYLTPETSRIVVRNLASGTERSVTVPPGDPMGQFLREPLAWSADGTHLIGRVAQGAGESLWYLDTKTLDSRRLGIDGDPSALSDLVPLGDDGQWAAVVGDGETARLVEFDPETEVVGRELLDLPGGGAVLDVDPSGRHVLLDDGSGSTARWTVGDDAPTELASDAREGAAW